MKDYIVEIYDINGEKRLVNANVQSINTGGLENGLYYIKIKSNTDFTNRIYKFIDWR